MINGDSLEVLKTLEANSVDSCVTDPPYELGFMGKHWDSTGIAYSVALWQEVYRVLKPGGHLLAFGGTRTYHRMTCAIEDAGFEIRDQMQWLYGSGFPKSHDISKAIDKQAPRVGMFDEFASHFSLKLKESGKSQKEVAALFPSKTGGLTGCVWNWANGANVPTVAQWKILKPLLNLSDEWLPLIERIEAEREVIGEERNTFKTPRLAYSGNDGFMNCGYNGDTINITAPATPAAIQWQGWGTALKPANEPICVARKPFNCTVAENVLQWGTGAINVDAGRIGEEQTVTTIKDLSEVHGNKFGISGAKYPKVGEKINPPGRWPANVILDEEAAKMLDEQSGESTSRFFYVAKASKREREAGLYGFELVQGEELSGGGGVSHPKADAFQARKEGSRANTHPTVKPIKLMEYLVKLVTPPNGIVLDPFAGSGTTGCACAKLGFGFIGIEKESKYKDIAEARIKHFACELA